MARWSPSRSCELLLVRGRTFDVVTQAQVSEAWLRLRDHLTSTATAWYLGELAERAVEERAGAWPVYALLRRAFQLLDDGMDPDRVARWFEIGLADALGVRPEVERCVECDRVPGRDGAIPLGAHARRPAVRGATRATRPRSRDLSLDALKLLRAYRRLDIEAIAALRLPPEVEAEVERADAPVRAPRARARGALAGVPRRGPRLTRHVRWRMTRTAGTADDRS